MSFVGMPNPFYRNNMQVLPYTEVENEGGEVGGVFTKPQMKNDVAKWKKFRKEHPKSKMTLATFLKKNGVSKVKKVAKKTHKKKGGIVVGGEDEDFDEYVDDEGGMPVGGEMGGVFTKSQMKKDVAKFNRHKKLHPYSKISFAKFLHSLTQKKKPKKGGIIVGGKYRPKGLTKAEAKEKFIEMAEKHGYSSASAKTLWANEEKKPARRDLRKNPLKKAPKNSWIAYLKEHQHEKGERESQVEFVKRLSAERTAKSIDDVDEYVASLPKSAPIILPYQEPTEKIAIPVEATKKEAMQMKHTIYPRWKSQFVTELGNQFFDLSSKQRKAILEKEWKAYINERFHPGYTGTGF